MNSAKWCLPPTANTNRCLAIRCLPDRIRNGGARVRHGVVVHVQLALFNGYAATRTCRVGADFDHLLRWGRGRTA